MLNTEMQPPKNLWIDKMPVEAPIFLLRGQHRYRILIKGSSRKLLNEYTKFLLKKYPLPPPLKRIVDVDPYTFM